MANPVDFAKNIIRRSEQVLLGTRQVKALAAVRASSVVAQDTPVASGFTRSNWVTAIGAADLSPRSIRSVGDVASEAQGVAIAARLEDSIHIANGGEKAPWLAGLNDGNSQKAPAGFFQGAVLAARTIIQGFRLLK